MSDVQEVSHASFEGFDRRGRPFRSEKIPIRPGLPGKPPEVRFSPTTDVLVSRFTLLDPYGKAVWAEGFGAPVLVPGSKDLRVDIPDAILMRFNGKVVLPFLISR